MSSRSPIESRGQNDPVAEHFRRSCETLSRAADDPNLRAKIHEIAEAITAAFRGGHKLLIAGNGGSAADAQHIAGEFLSRLNFDRNPLPAIALTTDSSVLTAIGNDYGFDRTFERQVRGLGQPGDVFIAISTSGRSPNVIAALKAAREGGLTTIGFTGSGANGFMQPLCDHCLAAPSCGNAPHSANPYCGGARDLWPCGKQPVSAAKINSIVYQYLAAFSV